MICIRATPASVVDLNFRPSSWLGWMTLFIVVRNWSFSPITFSISLSIMLSKTIGLNDLGESYEALLSLGIMTVIDFLKWEGQNPKLIHVLAMLMMMPKQSSSLRMILRWLYDNLSGPSVEKLLQLAMALLNSSLENRAYEERGLLAILSRILMSTWRWRAVLKVKWSAFHKSSMVRHGWLLYVFVNPVHEFPRSLFFVGDFLDFKIKEGSLGGFDCFLEDLPVFESSCRPIIP